MTGHQHDPAGPTPEQLTEITQIVLDLARAGDDERLAAYLDTGVPADLVDADGNTLVMLAADHGRESTVALLAGRGADVNRPADDGRTAIARAVVNGEPAIVRALLAFGADPRSGTPNALDAARTAGRSELVAELEEAGDR